MKMTKMTRLTKMTTPLMTTPPMKRTLMAASPGVHGVAAADAGAMLAKANAAKAVAAAARKKWTKFAPSGWPCAAATRSRT